MIRSNSLTRVNCCNGCQHATYCGTDYFIKVNVLSSVNIELSCTGEVTTYNGKMRYNSMHDVLENCKDLTLEDTLLLTKFIKENNI